MFDCVDIRERKNNLSGEGTEIGEEVVLLARIVEGHGLSCSGMTKNITLINIESRLIM